MREVSAWAFWRCKQLRRALLNEGLEILGKKGFLGKQKYDGNAFAESALETTWLQSTLRRLEARTFYDCRNLKRLEIPSGVEHLGEECFGDRIWCSRLEEITLPRTLREVRGAVFEWCSRLRVVRMERGCGIDARKYVPHSARVRCK